MIFVCGAHQTHNPNCSIFSLLYWLFLSSAEVAHQFQYAVRVIGSNYAPTIERDEFLVSEKIKKERKYATSHLTAYWTLQSSFFVPQPGSWILFITSSVIVYAM